MDHIDRVDVAIIGGGIAGLVAASYAARAGRSVGLFERAGKPGGRAQTTVVDGFRLNLGAHALYVRGANAAILDELAIELGGSQPEAARYLAMRGGRLFSLPASALALASTRLLGTRAKIELGRLYASLGDVDADALDSMALREWIERQVSDPSARAALEAITRLSTYTNDPGRASAGAVVRQLRIAGGGVRYLDGGWQVLVDALRDRAIEAGVQLETGSRVRRIVFAAGEAAGVVVAEDRIVRAGSVIVATPLAEAASLTGVDEIAAWAAAAVPVRAAVLDLAMSTLPNPRHVFALGIDTPTYFSVHSTWAKLAPRGQHVVHLMKYLPPAADDRGADERDLEEALDLCQPGWRTHVVERRYLPRMTVTGWLPVAAGGGLGGRPGPAVPGVRNLFVAGDWVGGEGMLSDGAFASGKQAAGLAASAAVSATAAA